MKGKSNMSNSETSSEIQKRDYIHVRARRGEATDRHSLAERVRVVTEIEFIESSL